MKNNSYWQNENKQFSFSNEHPTSTDVLIIGGGMTGIMTAYELSKQSNLTITIASSHPLAIDVSSKTSAKITPMHNLMYQDIYKVYGQKKARQYYDSQVEAMNHMVEIIKKENIDCNLEKCHNYMYAQTNTGYKKLKKEYQTLKKLDIPFSLTNQLPIKLEIIKAIHYATNYSFHPIKYLNHIINILKQNPNVTILENYHICSFEKEDHQYTAHFTNGSHIICHHMVSATHYPIFILPGLYFTKLYQEKSYLIAFETTKEIQDLYINTDQPVRSLRSLHLSNKTIGFMIGNSHISGGTQPFNDPKNELLKQVKQFDPDAKIISTWTNQDVISVDYLPYIGQYSRRNKNMYVATAFQTWGMTNSHLAGMMMTDMILKKDNKYKDLYKTSRLSHLRSLKESIKLAGRSIDGFLLKRCKPSKSIEDLSIGEGAIVTHNGMRYAGYFDGYQYFLVKPGCTHTGCYLHFNQKEQTWDCPCHGSRFDIQGGVINGPANKPLPRKIIDTPNPNQKT